MTIDLNNDFLLDGAIRYALADMDKQRDCLLRALAGSQVDREFVRGILNLALPLMEDGECLATSAH